MPFRLATVGGRAVLLDGDGFHDVERTSGGGLSSDPLDALGDTDRLQRVATRTAGRQPDGLLADVTPGPPVPHPPSIFAVGRNYRGHAAEMAGSVPEVPLVFAKFTSCITGPMADVELRCEHADFEAELVVVIGRGGRDLVPDTAWEHVAGLTVGQDFTDRRLQRLATPPHFDLGKSRDGYGPIGPAIVSLDSFDDPSDLAIECRVDGALRQQDRTSSMVFGVPALLAHISSAVTLRTGDLVFTGTPSGVGHPEERYLRPGSIVETTIEGIGTLRNRCV